ncbi:MAG: Rha family transcriptional regulator [Sarcina sp.]
MENRVLNIENEEVRISSREVAEMMEVKKHSDMLSKIDKIDNLLNGKVRSVEYWIESSYKDSTGRTLREYLVSKKGCELLAHKSTGEKGIAFTIAYMNRFAQMEEVIKNQKLTPMQQLKLQYEVLDDHEERVVKIEKQLECMEVNPRQKLEIRKARNKKVMEILINKNTQAYKDRPFRSKVYAALSKEYCNYFEINSYEYTPKNRFDEALEFINEFSLPAELKMELKKINNQIEFFEV